jgi:meiotic recombination protein SPO11
MEKGGKKKRNRETEVIAIPLRDTEAQAIDAHSVLGAVRALRAKDAKDFADKNRTIASSTTITGVTSGSGSGSGEKDKSSFRALSSSAAGISGIREVKEQTADEVLDEIEKSLLVVARSVLAGEGFEYDVPSRGGANSKYEEALGRIVLHARTSTRSFSSVATARKAAILTRVMQLLFDVLRKGIHVTKRDLFYTDVKLFVSQKESDVTLEDAAAMLGCTRTSMHVVASDKGIVVGRLQFKDDGDYIDCTRMGIGGKKIPPFMDKVTEIKSDAEFILLVEKEAAFMRIAEDRFYNKYRCIVLTAKGQPDVATRLFLRKLKFTLNIPVLGLVDSDPYGLKILSVYMSGSKAMSYDSASLTTPDIKWLGIRPSDLDRYNIPEQCRLPMNAADIKTGMELLKEDFVQQNKAWVKELELMIKTKQKAEIQSLSSFDFQYLTQVYLPQKIKDGDWI